MSCEQMVENLDMFANRLNTEIENISSGISSSSSKMYDVKSFCDLVNSQLETLKFAVKYEIGALKSEIGRDTAVFDVKTYQDEEFKRIADELKKAKQLIKLHHLTGLIENHIIEKFK